MVARGDVWWYEDPRTGRRPFLVITRNEAIPVLNQLLAVPATRTVRGIPTEVELDESDGMPARCVLALDNISLVRSALLTEHITRLAPPRMRAVCDALALTTAC